MITIGNDRVEQLIRKLIFLTTEKKINWLTLPYYLDENDNEPLRHAVIESTKDSYSYTLGKLYQVNEYRSYCATMNGGLVIVFCKEKEKVNEYKLELYIQTSSVNPLTEVVMSDYTRKMLDELIFQINSSTNDTGKFIDEILEL